MNSMKRMMMAVAMALCVMAASAQQSSESYIVKTKNVKKTVKVSTAATMDANGQVVAEEPQKHDFISDNFKYYSLCDWQEGMRFMVLPEKIDMLINTFCDAATGKEVSSGRLRQKIMVYKGHRLMTDGHTRLNFFCEDDSHSYYFQIPNGSFDDYCFGKLGVPTLAYLGDVDIARKELVGKKLLTRTTVYREDTDWDGDGFKEVTVPKNTEVTVTAVGVGTRNYPVKIIVEDDTGKEFYQNVAISKTNSGMRDDEFIMDKAKFAFKGSFDLTDAVMEVSTEYSKYINKVVYTKYATDMVNSKGRTVKVPRLTDFTIEDIRPIPNSNYVTMYLKENTAIMRYTKKVTFTHENVAGDIDGYREDYFGYLFGMGEGQLKGTSMGSRALIREGRVAVGFTEDEVKLAVGKPNKTASSSSGSPPRGPCRRLRP